MPVPDKFRSSNDGNDVRKAGNVGTEIGLPPRFKYLQCNAPLSTNTHNGTDQASTNTSLTESVKRECFLEGSYVSIVMVVTDSGIVPAHRL